MRNTTNFRVGDTVSLTGTVIDLDGGCIQLDNGDDDWYVAGSFVLINRPAPIVKVELTTQQAELVSALLNGETSTIAEGALARIDTALEEF